MMVVAPGLPVQQMVLVKVADIVCRWVVAVFLRLDSKCGWDGGGGAVSCAWSGVSGTRVIVVVSLRVDRLK